MYTLVAKISALKLGQSFSTCTNSQIALCWLCNAKSHETSSGSATLILFAPVEARLLLSHDDDDILVGGEDAPESSLCHNTTTRVASRILLQLRKIIHRVHIRSHIIVQLHFSTAGTWLVWRLSVARLLIKIQTRALNCSTRCWFGLFIVMSLQLRSLRWYRIHAKLKFIREYCAAAARHVAVAVIAVVTYVFLRSETSEDVGGPVSAGNQLKRKRKWVTCWMLHPWHNSFSLE